MAMICLSYDNHMIVVCLSHDIQDGLKWCCLEHVKTGEVLLGIKKTVPKVCVCVCVCVYVCACLYVCVCV